MARRPDRPTRVEYWGHLEGSVQVLECRIITPKRSVTNGFRIAVLNAPEPNESRDRVQAKLLQLVLVELQQEDTLYVIDTQLAALRSTRALLKQEPDKGDVDVKPAEPSLDALAIEVAEAQAEGFK